MIHVDAPVCWECGSIVLASGRCANCGYMNPLDRLPSPQPPPKPGGKQRWLLFPWTAACVCLEVIEFGARKYREGDWKDKKYDRRYFVEKAIRHLVAELRGEIADPESRLPHLAHAAVDLLFALEKTG